MRVLLVTNTYPPADISGVGSLAAELFQGLAGRADIRVLTRVAPPGHSAVEATGGSRSVFPLRAALRTRLVGSGAPDVIHVNESDGVLIALRVATRRRMGRSVPRLVAAFQVSYVTEALSVRPVEVGGKTLSVPVTSERIFKHLRAPILTLAGRLTARLADHVVACSRFTARELEKDYGVNPAQTTVIPNGLRVAPEDILRSDGPRVAGVLNVLFVGRLRTRKAVAVLLEALTSPDAASVRLTIVGDGEQREALERQAAASGLGERVRFTGKVPRDRIAEHYRRADVFVLPSTYEGLPVAILEAMSHGLPVVATRVAGVPEAVDHEITGLLVEPEDAAGLASALAMLAGTPSRRTAMGEAALRRVREEFAVEQVGSRYLDLWQQVASDGPAKGAAR